MNPSATSATGHSAATRPRGGKRLPAAKRPDIRPGAKSPSAKICRDVRRTTIHNPLKIKAAERPAITGRPERLEVDEKRRVAGRVHAVVRCRGTSARPPLDDLSPARGA